MRNGVEFPILWGASAHNAQNRDMQKKYHKTAIVSWVAGLIAFSFAMSHLTGLVVLGIPLGLVALGIGTSGAYSIHRSAPAFRGTGLAIGGALFGVLATVVGIGFFAGLFFQQIDPHRWQKIRSEKLEKAMAAAPVSNEPVSAFTSNLPIIVLHTAGQHFSKETSRVIRAEFFDTEDGKTSFKSKPAYEGLIDIHLRGHSSLELPKHSYTVHMLDAKTNQTKVALLGLPKEEDWVLYAPFEDKTMIRDVLAFQLASKMGRYAPRTRYVELFLSRSENGVSMRDYAGVYVLMEKIKRGEDRVKIAKLTPEDRTEPEISGGYIVKRDHDERNGSRIRTSYGGPYYFVYPNPEKVTAQQKAWLKDYLSSFESALYSSDFKDPKTGYAAYLDVDAFIDAHWLVEMSKNVDGFRYSSFLTKDRGGKLKPGPPWDWNRSFGNANYYNGDRVNGWYWAKLRPHEISWYRRLREDPDFEERCVARWFELRKNVFDPKKINATIDQLAAQLEDAQHRNFKRWPILGQQVTCNAYVGDSYEDEVRWLKEWVTGRIAWIDKQMNAATRE